ncbi:MAG: ABC transporter permease [Pseudobdellovibrionaceae bacterium]
MLFTDFWKKTQAASAKASAGARLAVASQLEYRFNLFVDAVMQPTITACVEMIVWFAIVANFAAGQLGGFSAEYYLAYALWGAFFARNNSNWMYEFRMINEIESGSVNNLLTRPVGFFEFYLSQFMGYKLLVGIPSLLVPLIVGLAMSLPVDLTKLPLSLILSFYYLFFVYVFSFCVVSCAFFFNRVGNFSIAKNVAFWLFTGELFPLDLVPDPYKEIMISLPFANAVYIPIGYMTGRVGIETILKGFMSVTLSSVVVGLLAAYLWNRGRKVYSGTGA